MSLINTIDELKQYVEIASGLKFDSIKPSIRTAERRQLISVLGKEQYDQLLAAYDAATKNVEDMTGSLQTLAEFAQEAIANIALMYAVPRLSVQVSPTGILRNEGPDKKTAYQYQQQDLQESYGRAGFDALESMLEHLEYDKEEYPLWVASSAYLYKKKYFIESGAQFSENYFINQSRLTYLALRPIMKRVEDFQIAAVTGKPIFIILKAGIIIDDLEPEYIGILEDYIRPAVALLTVAKGLIERALDITETGVSISLTGLTQNNQQKNPAPSDKIRAAVAQLTADGNEYLSRLSAYLGDNPLLFPDYALSLDVPGMFNIINRQDRGIFGV